MLSTLANEYGHGPGGAQVRPIATARPEEGGLSEEENPKRKEKIP